MRYRSVMKQPANNRPGHEPIRGRASGSPRITIICECGWEADRGLKRTSMQQWQAHVRSLPSLPSELA
jgi:hypothetical protein